MILAKFHHVELPPPSNSTCPHTDIHIQTDGDYTKCVVTPFGTTRLKMTSPTIFVRGGGTRPLSDFCTNLKMDKTDKSNIFLTGKWGEPDSFQTRPKMDKNDKSKNFLWLGNPKSHLVPGGGGNLENVSSSPRLLVGGIQGLTNIIRQAADKQDLESCSEPVSQKLEKEWHPTFTTSNRLSFYCQGHPPVLQLKYKSRLPLAMVTLEISCGGVGVRVSPNVET